MGRHRGGRGQRGIDLRRLDVGSPIGLAPESEGQADNRRCAQQSPLARHVDSPSQPCSRHTRCVFSDATFRRATLSYQFEPASKDRLMSHPLQNRAGFLTVAMLLVPGLAGAAAPDTRLVDAMARQDKEEVRTLMKK